MSSQLMSIDKTTQLISTRNEENSNLLLRVGWTLLLVAKELHKTSALRTCGWMCIADGEPQKVPPTSLFSFPTLRALGSNPMQTVGQIRCK
jgi:hypothetical protein